MNQLEKLWESVKKAEAALLATSADGSVTMRTVSPVYYRDAILIFTCSKSQKYQQMKANPNCCVEIGGYFVEAKPEFLGLTMLDENAALREVYAEKFTDAFDEDAVYGGRKAEFVLLKPVRVKSWMIENGAPTGPFEHEFS